MKIRKAIHRTLEEAVRDRVFPGAVCSYTTPTEDATVAIGTQRYTASPALTEDAIFDVASITKSIPTASLALQLLDEKKLHIDGQLIEYIPEFQSNYREDVTIRHLLSFTLDYQLPLSSLKERTSQDMLEAVLNPTFTAPPGKVYRYSNACSLLLGFVIERVTGKPLDIAAAERFFTPLEMRRTNFHPAELPESAIVPSEIDSWRGRELKGEIHDESSYVLREEGRVTGSAGLFSTAPDLQIFLKMLLAGGRYQGRRYFSPKIMSELQENQLAGLGEWGALGWGLNQPSFMGRLAGPKTLGKTGFTGGMVIVDIPRQVAVTLLSNHTYPKRPADRTVLNAVRSRVMDTIWQSLA